MGRDPGTREAQAQAAGSSGPATMPATVVRSVLPLAPALDWYVGELGTQLLECIALPGIEWRELVYVLEV